MAAAPRGVTRGVGVPRWETGSGRDCRNVTWTPGHLVAWTVRGPAQREGEVARKQHSSSLTAHTLGWEPNGSLPSRTGPAWAGNTIQSLARSRPSIVAVPPSLGVSG